MTEAVKSSKGLLKNISNYTASIGSVLSATENVMKIDSSIQSESVQSMLLVELLEIIKKRTIMEESRNVIVSDCLRFYSQPCMDSAGTLIDRSKSALSSDRHSIVHVSQNLGREWDHLRRNRQAYLKKCLLDTADMMSKEVITLLIFMRLQLYVYFNYFLVKFSAFFDFQQSPTFE